MPGRVDYDRISERYDSHRGWEEATPRRLLRLATGEETAFARPRSATAAPRPPILEIGCGTGNLTQWLFCFWPGPVAALDASRGMLAKARAKLAGPWLVRADATRLPFADRTFTAALGTFVLHHLDAPGCQRMFAELRRALRAHGGIAFLTTSHAQIKNACLTRWFPSFEKMDYARFPDLPELRAEISAAGFASIGTEEVVRSTPRGDAAYLAKVKARFISTFELLPPSEFDAGIAAMEKQLAAAGHLGDVSWHGTIVYARV